MIMAGMCASAISAAEEKKVVNKKVNYQTYAAELDKTAYSGSDLGAVWSEDSTTFKVWAPKAATVKLIFTSTAVTKGRRRFYCHKNNGA